MSWYAHAWAESAPVADVQEFAILAVMAQYANLDGTGIYKSNSTIARTIRCDEKTVKRRIQAMVRRGLLALGDQSAAAHIEEYFRPKVYDMLIPYHWFSADQLEKVNRERAASGLGPLTEEDRPPIPDAPPSRRPRSDRKMRTARKPAGCAKRATPVAPEHHEGGTTSPGGRGLVVRGGGDYQSPNTVHVNRSIEPVLAADAVERSAGAPPPQAAWDDRSANDRPPPSYYNEPKEWIEHKALGFDAGEEPMVDDMLDKGYEPKAILNKLLKDRYGNTPGGGHSRIKGDWRRYVKRSVAGWRPGEYDLARKLLADYHPDLVVEALIYHRSPEPTWDELLATIERQVNGFRGDERRVAARLLETANLPTVVNTLRLNRECDAAA